MREPVAAPHRIERSYGVDRNKFEHTFAFRQRDTWRGEQYGTCRQFEV